VHSEWNRCLLSGRVSCSVCIGSTYVSYMSQEVEWVVTLNCLYGNEKIPLVEMLNIDLATVQFSLFSTWFNSTVLCTVPYSRIFCRICRA